MVTMINESDICVNYRQAKDKAAQITILADLYATTPVNIRDILARNGFIVGSVKAAAAIDSTRTRKRWTPDIIEEVAKLWANGATADELSQQYQTTISAIVGLQRRNKEVFERCLSQSVRVPPPTAPSESATEEQEEAVETMSDEKVRSMAERGWQQYKTPPSIAGAKLNTVNLLLSHAKALQQSAHDALSEGRNIDCAYALGELSQVLIRAKETSTQP